MKTILDRIGRSTGNSELFIWLALREPNEQLDPHPVNLVNPVEKPISGDRILF